MDAPAVLQLDCQTVAHWDVVGTSSQLGPILNPRPVWDFSAKATRGMLLDFFVKSQNGLVWPVFALFIFC